jgi:choline dehydrogenase-like flavoprotein
MGNDPATSVVDPYGRAHDVPNLFLVGGSIFVTGGSANHMHNLRARAAGRGAHRGKREGREGERMTASISAGPPLRLSVPPSSWLPAS